MDPVIVIGIVAILSMLLGFYLGRGEFTKSLDESLHQAQAEKQKLEILSAQLQEKNSSLTTDLFDEKNAREKLKFDLLACNNETRTEQEKVLQLSNAISAAEATIRANNSTISELRNAQNLSLSEQTELHKRLLQINDEISKQGHELAAKKQAESDLLQNLEAAKRGIADFELRVTEFEKSLIDERKNVAEMDKQLAASHAREEAQKKEINDKEVQLGGLQEKLKAEFKNIATEILLNSTQQVSKFSDDTLQNLLAPFKIKIDEFQKKIEDTHENDIRERAGLDATIKKLAETHNMLSGQAENLTKALRGEPQKRGRWGEMILERILEASGLERGREFVTQGQGLEMVGSAGNQLKPDVVVLLPDDRNIIIDSKVSLVRYEEYFEAADEIAQDAAAKGLALSMRAHIDGLAGKEYQFDKKILSHEYILMFVPNEGAVALALQKDPTIFELGWNKRIVIVGPSTLLMTMKTVEAIWRYEKQNKNAKAIAHQAGQLYDKLCGFMTDFVELGEKLGKASSAHADATKKLSSGQGNLIGRALKLRELGVKPSKQLPRLKIDGQEVDLEPDENTGDVSENASLRIEDIEQSPIL